MAIKITRDILEGHLMCKYKSYLKLIEEDGQPSDYGQLLQETRARIRLAARDKLLARYRANDIVHNLLVQPAVLKQGASLLLNVAVETKELSLCFDALQRVHGPSSLGDFHYIPVLFHEAEHPSRAQRSLLELHGLILGVYQGREPDFGVLMHGQSCAVTRMRLPLHNGQARQVLQDIKALQTGSPPRLVLNSHCGICEFRQRCQAEARAKDDLSLLRGIGEKEIVKYNKRGIFTVMQLSCTFRPRKQPRLSRPKPQSHQAALQALAIREQKVYVYGTPELPTCPTRIYFDLEGDPERRFTYLLGMIVQIKTIEERYSFWADTPAAEVWMYQQFLNVVSRHDVVQLYAYGRYESAFLRRMLKYAEPRELGERPLARLTNVLSIIYAHVYFPTYSNGLKEIGRYLGCHWSDAEASGIQSIVWRRQWEATGAAGLKHKLTTYNLEDCVALQKVTECLYAIGTHRSGAAEDQSADHARPQVARVEELDPQWSRREWGKADFAISEFDFINKCAYFDYQHDRIYIRTHERLKRSQTRLQRRKGKRHLQANRCIEIKSQSCPVCGGTGLTRRPDGRLARLAFDLRIIQSGIRRWVTRFTTAWHWCAQCEQRFIPQEYLNLDEHFHTLKSWAMYEHVAHRTSLSNVAEKLKQYFQLPVFDPDVYYFKRLMSLYYAETYQQLWEKLVAGTVVHADETEIHLKQVGKGYIWVFTNMEEVVFLYKASREGQFLHDLLKDFRGVLVSDFYAAYDALPCAQQKCLIHLLRDLNHDVQHNPWDEECKTLASDFGKLLRAIVTTIDRYGLKKRHLNKHRGDIDTFFRAVSGRRYGSEVAQGYQQRLTKYRDKLFTFVNHDGVPWNNNNAEHAVKRLADYRQLMDGRLTEVGLKEYLVLLSLYATCKYKGINFLQFLLSREKSIDGFCQTSHRRALPPTIVLIPDGFTFSRRSRRRDRDHTPTRPIGDAGGEPGPAGLS